ncbi:MAG: LacI family transcriptional regulator [unclassified Hahellaceae]|nr:LacI family transcriptional regulator [Hahellaceae bacterium]|tara:strand:- start:39683 stop:40699 length:1017 start_codon:yes stop_codon:yes gene_type:complete
MLRREDAKAPMTTIKEIAKLAGVSAGTVSRALNNQGRIERRTRERVIALAAELGYQPNSLARSLVTRQGHGIGLLVGGFDGVYYGPLMAAVEAALREAGQMLIVANGESLPELERQASSFLNNQQLRALILHPLHMTDEELLALNLPDRPVVVINRLVPGLEAQCVVIDHELGGALAARHLMTSGHRKIATITGPQSLADARSRHKGFLQALADEGQALPESRVVEGDYSVESGRRGATELLASGRDFTAVFCGNDDTAIGAMAVFRENGLRIPDDVALIGYDDSRLAEHLVPPLTTVHSPFTDMGEAAALLVRQLTGEIGLKPERFLRPSLVVRESA